MLGRLEMDIQSAIDAYAELSSSVFTPKRKVFSLVRRASDFVSMTGRFSTAGLEQALKDTISSTIGEENAMLLSPDETRCKV
jgi:hypothetical protein